jgi:hypothetical protein
VNRLLEPSLTSLESVSEDYSSAFPLGFRTRSEGLTRKTSVADAPLTPLGRQQSAELDKDTQEIQRTAQLLVSSALRRPLSTMVIGYPSCVSAISRAYCL